MSPLCLAKTLRCWLDRRQISEQKSFTDGRIVVAGSKVKRRPQKRVDYLLRYRRDFAIAVVEAKTVCANPGDGLQQAKEYAQILGLKFAFATNGHGIVEHDFLTGRDNDLEGFSSADALWKRLRASEGIDEKTAERVLAPCYPISGKAPRYYQEIAINRAVQAILQGERRVLLTLATGTGKTVIAFQICYKLWSSRWNRTGEARRARILFLADRNVLLDVPKDQTFTPFGDARWKIEGEAVKSREMYFATYQAIAQDEHRPGLYREFPCDFFDLIVVDECHRGSARSDSSWREILKYFKPAFQLGMTATPLREDNRDTYDVGGGNGGGGSCRRRCRRPAVCDGRGNVGASAAVAHPATRSAGRDGKAHGLLGDIEQLSESLQRYPWTSLAAMKGDQQVIRKLEETERLIKELKKALSR